MNMNFELSLTQEQKLIMTQEMQLSVKLLQMSSLELQEHVEKEIQENPVLDYAEPSEESISREKNRIEYKELIKYLNFDNYNNSYYDKNNEELSPFYFVHEKKTLSMYLKEQIGEIVIDNFHKTVCYYIIDNLNEKGYLDLSTEEIARELRIRDTIASEALEAVQNLEPVGIAARDLKECLILQLTRKNNKDKNLFYVIENHLEDIADNKYINIAKSLSIDIKKAQSYGDIIKTLEPIPSRGFYTGEEVKYIVPDAYICKLNGSFQVIMNDSVIPKLKINEIYREIITNEKDKEAVEYVKTKLDNALFLIRSMEHRKSTIYKVLEKIVELQTDYFEFGDTALKPMTLRDIADSLSMHESTVSRAIKDKYINIDKGIVRIKDLFTTGLYSKDDSKDVSTAIIKKEIKVLIDKENKNNPLSDQGLCDILNNKGMNISRRTVAKYREEMDIKASSKRKRY